MKSVWGGRIAAVIMGMSGVGCAGPSEQGGPGSGDEPAQEKVSIEEFQQVFAQRYPSIVCRALFECPEAVADAVPFLGRFADRAACEAGVLDLLPEAPLEGEALSAEQGRMTFDEARGASCLDALDALAASNDACVVLSSLEGTACEGVYRGRVEDGRPCLGDRECVSGSCSFEVDSDACYAVCDASSSCGGVTCGDDEYCADGLSCSPKLREGDACSEWDDCTLESDSVGCLVGDDGGVCTRFGTVAQGEACGFSGEFCASGLTCDVDSSVCVPSDTFEPSFVGDGEPCDFSGTLCQPGLVCTALDVTDEPSGTCASPGTTGTQCFTTMECGIGLACVGATFLGGASSPGACGPLVEDGGDCLFDFDCVSGVCDTLACGSAQDECVIP